jgi:hypothetical protein
VLLEQADLRSDHYVSLDGRLCLRPVPATALGQPDLQARVVTRERRIVHNQT